MNIYDFFTRVVEGLFKWFAVHYDRDTWMRDHVGVDDIIKYFRTSQGVLSSNYYTFNWSDAAYLRMAQRLTYYKCSECGLINEGSCPDHDAENFPLDVKDAAWYFKDANFALDALDLWNALEFDGFAAYQAAVCPLTDPIRDEVVDYLKAIHNAETREDQLLLLMWTLKIMHVNGNIAVDYGELSFEMVDAVRSMGVEKVFGRRDVEKFMSGEYMNIQVNMVEMERIDEENQDRVRSGNTGGVGETSEAGTQSPAVRRQPGEGHGS